MNEFAKQVFDYFTAKMASTGQPLDMEENVIFRKAQSLLNVFPVCCMTPADLEILGFETSGLDASKLQRLAEKMGNVYVENDYWLRLELMADQYCIPRIPLEERMRRAYTELVHEGIGKFTAEVNVRLEDGKSLHYYIHITKNTTANSGMGLNVPDVDTLCSLTKPNGYGLVITDFFGFVNETDK